MGHEDGGPAFPVIERVSVYDYGAHNVSGDAGMSLRDYFAAAALTGVAGDPNSYQTHRDQLAAWAYSLADAMLEARKPSSYRPTAREDAGREEAP